MFFEIQRLPPGLNAQRLGDDTRRMPALKLEQTRPQPDLLSGTGPHVPGVSRGTVVDSQDDIDALLASVAGGK